MSGAPPSSQAFSELISDPPRNLFTMTIKADELRKAETEKPKIKPSRFLRRCNAKVILAFAKIFEEFKVEYGDLIKQYGKEVPPEFRSKCRGYFQAQWKRYCEKWNKRRGLPKIDPELFNKEAIKYINELRTMQADGSVQ